MKLFVLISAATTATIRRGLALLLVSLLITGMSEAESLRVLERFDLDKDYVVSRVLWMGGDTVMFIADDGLYARGNADEEWRKLMDRAPWEEEVPTSVCDGKYLTRFQYPGGLWQHKGKNGNEILLFEGHCRRLYKLAKSDDGSLILTKCDKLKSGDMYGNTNVQGDLMLTVLWGNDTQERLVLQKVGGDDYRRLFHMSEHLVAWRDSVILDHGPLGFPALNPHDSAIWLAVDGYPFVYIINWDGELRDSVQITNSDYHQAPLPLSRIESEAVSDEWQARWTPTLFFSYISPGYFVLQYRVETKSDLGEVLVTFPKVVWDTNKQVIPLTIDPLWRLAGVQDDGRIIFVAREADSSGCKETLIVARIEP